jgi:hypothetical protein
MLLGHIDKAMLQVSDTGLRRKRARENAEYPHQRIFCLLADK